VVTGSIGALFDKKAGAALEKWLKELRSN